MSAGERLCLVGRNGSGKSTLLQDRGGADRARRRHALRAAGRDAALPAAGAGFAGFATARAYVEAGLGPGDDPHRAVYLLGKLGLSGEEDPGALVRRRGAPRGAGARAGARARYPAARRADQPSRPAGDRMAGERAAAHGSALVLISHDRRFLEIVARHRVARSRQHAAARKGFAAFEAWRDEVLAQEETRAAQARPQNREGGRLGALWRQRRGASATVAAWRGCGACARSSASSAAHGQRQVRRRRGATRGASCVIEAERDFEILRRPLASCATSRSASSAATALASSAPTAPARRRCSTC